jgi:hypothetical protein
MCTQFADYNTGHESAVTLFQDTVSKSSVEENDISCNREGVSTSLFIQHLKLFNEFTCNLILLAHSNTCGENLIWHVPTNCRSQWPRRLRHERSSLARTLGSWVRIRLKTWMSVCEFIPCVYCAVCR